MIRITRNIALEESEIQQDFIRSSGPGGQNVNKVASAVQLRFDVANSPSLPEEVRQRLLLMAGKRITEDGILIIVAQRFRTQGRNRQDAIDRLIELIQDAVPRPKIRHKTRATLASKRRRLDSKHHRADIKRMRGTDQHFQE